MKIKLIFIFIIASIKLFAQCGEEYPNAFYQNIPLVTIKGDTVNKLDSSGLYEGLHYYTDNDKGVFNDSTTFICGYFHHGLPIGEWTDYCNDGSYSKGQFSCGGGESSSDGKGGWITKKQGIYVKIGDWKYYDKNNKLIKTLRYERFEYKNGWTNKYYIADSLGNFILIKLESNLNYSTKYRKEISKIYTEKGIPVSYDYTSFWKDISYEYNDKGQISKITKRRKFFGKRLNTTIEKEYDDKGQLKCKTKTKCDHSDYIIEVHHL